MTISFSWLKKNKLFSESMKKITLNTELNHNEVEFMLGCAILFLKEYDGDKRKSPYFEIAYYIVLKCAINNDCYDALLDVCSNFGLYPISDYIIRNKLTINLNNLSFPLEYQLEKFRHQNITETYEQKKIREQIVHSDNNDNCYVAPTSFGKSSLIIEIIKKKKNSKKISIIVPTKSLLIQTYKSIKSNFPNTKIIFHDEMYDGSERFISVFTQERALRLLKDKEISFDLLIIDEAHNIFEIDSRSILLTRLIRRNRFRNPKSQTYYLSPLISEMENLKIEEGQKIFERRILNNIKEPDIYEYRTNGDIFKYNRFMNEFYHLDKEVDYTSYILDNMKSKNFLYLKAPKKVEEFSKYFNEHLSSSNSDELFNLSEVISKNVHDDFYCVEYIKKGFIYLHGKLPDLIKEYLEHKFKNTHGITCIIANSVILEGVNLPIDNLFILNTNGLNAKSLTNLIGRVNRLNEVFDDNNKSLKKLSPSVHFINSDDFNRKNGKMENQIKLLKNSTFKDIIKNPLLANFDINELIADLETARKANKLNESGKMEKQISSIEQIKQRENFLIFNENDEADKVKRIFMESGISSIYHDTNVSFKRLEKRINTIKKNAEWTDSNVIDKIYLFFIDGMEGDISDAMFLRLKNKKARAFYKGFTDNIHRLNLKEHISKMIGYFHSIKNKDSGREFYIGSSYGEFAKSTTSGYEYNTYIDLSKKTDKELANIALVKIKIESDFLSYTLNEYANILFDLNLIEEDEYNLYIYGTKTKKNAGLVKIGLSGSLINKLDRDGQITNLQINKFGIIEYNNDFYKYIKKQDDLMQFEVTKYIDIR